MNGKVVRADFPALDEAETRTMILEILDPVRRKAFEAAGEVAALDVPAGVVPSAQRAAPERGALPWILAGGAVAAFAGAGATYAQSLAAAEDGDAAAREMTVAETREVYNAARARVRSADDDAALNYSIALGCAAAGAALGGIATWLFLSEPEPLVGADEGSP
jgi:hypothetical protein